MGEKLLAQRILCLLRDTKSQSGKAATAMIDWATDQRDWLWPDRVWRMPKQRIKGETIDWKSLPRLAGEIDLAEDEPCLFASARAVCALLALEPFECEALRLVAALDALPRLSALRNRLVSSGEDVVSLVGMLAGAAPAAAAPRIRRSALVSLGLVELSAESYSGALDLTLHWRFADLLAEGIADEARLIGALAGIPQRATLAPDDFAEQRETFDRLARLLGGAVAAGAAGVNVLIHGPPGTGKTEFARTLAKAAGCELYAVAEFDSDGDEPNRFQRLHGLKRAQRLLARRSSSLILFDEMEDLFAEGAGSTRRPGSKIFVNRMLEQNEVPTIWTSNAIDDVDPAHLRRMSYVHRFDYPGPRARERIAEHIASSEGAIDAAAGLKPLLVAEPESAAIARVAIRSAALSGGGADDASAAARSLLLSLRGERALAPRAHGSDLDLALYEADCSLAALVDEVSRPGAPSDFSLLLTGPPGTGKTALAAHLATRLDRPLAIKRASDLLSKWVGDTEANIARAFAEARDEGAVLLFDEADSLLHDRHDAQRSWEVTQVNELLTWMDTHPLPFIAATNFAGRLDPAALRRFVFKIDLRAMSEDIAARAFELFFGLPATSCLRRIRGLTPGDFAVVKRQLRYRRAASASDIVELLQAEVAAKPERAARIGF